MGVGGWAGGGGEWSRHTARSCDHHRWWNVTIFSACVEATVCWLLFQTRCWWGTTTTSQWISLLWGLRRSWTWTQATSWKPGERVCERFCKYPPKWCTYNANWLWHSWCHAKCFYLIYTRGTRQNDAMQSASISFIHVAPGKMMPCKVLLSHLYTWHQAKWCHAKCFYLIYTRGTRQNDAMQSASISFIHVAPGKMLPSHSCTCGFLPSPAHWFLDFFFSHYLPKWCTYSSSGCYIAGAVWNASSWCMHLLVVTISSMLI